MLYHFACFVVCDAAQSGRYLQITQRNPPSSCSRVEKVSFIQSRSSEPAVVQTIYTSLERVVGVFLGLFKHPFDTALISSKNENRIHAVRKTNAYLRQETELWPCNLCICYKGNAKT